MWIIDNQINKLVHILKANVPIRHEFIDNTKYATADLSTLSPIANNYLYSIKIDNLNKNKQFYGDLLVSLDYSGVYDIINQTTTNYKLSSIELLDSSKSYITNYNIQANSNLNNLYIFTDREGIVNILVKYTITNIKKYSDIDCFINNHSNITTINYQENYSSIPLSITTDFLTNKEYSTNNILTITYSFPINLNYLYQSIGFNTASIYKFKSIFFNTNLISNLSYIELDYVIYNSSKYFNLYSLDSIFSFIDRKVNNSLIHGFITNSDYFILINK
jgi:hypothetical protein